MKYAIRVLCLICAGVVAVTGGFLLWDRLYNTPDMTYEEFQKACAEGKAPDDFGGIAEDGTTLFVTRDSLHSLDYWNKIAKPEGSSQPFQKIVRVDFSFHEVRNAYIEAAACLYGGWDRKYSFHAQAVFGQNIYLGEPILEELLRPNGVYAPSVEEANVPGYHIYVRLWGKDADLIWEKLKEKFGDIVQPWNEASQYAWSVMGPDSEQVVGWTEDFDPLVPIDLKSP